MSSRFASDDQDLTIESRREGNATVVTTRGEVTVFSSPTLREALRKIAGTKPGRIVFDLSETRYVDSSGVATFVEVLKLVRQHKGEVVLAGVSDRVRGVFEIARLDSLFPMVPTVQEALKP
jgi:anti-sigma B factor antagonist